MAIKLLCHAALLSNQMYYVYSLGYWVSITRLIRSYLILEEFAGRLEFSNIFC